MSKLDLARRGVSVAKGLRALVNAPVSLAEAEVHDPTEIERQPQRLLRSLDELVWPSPTSPTRRLLEAAGAEPADVASLVAELGVVGALEQLRDRGVYVSYEEYHGRQPIQRGSTTFEVSPADFFNPVSRADYLATTGGSRSEGTPVELSFAWQRRQGVQRAVQLDIAGVLGAPTATWLPVFPSAAGFGAVMKLTAGGNRPERWFSQIPTDLVRRQQPEGRGQPVPAGAERAGPHGACPRRSTSPPPIPSPSSHGWRTRCAGTARPRITGYASSLTAAARWASEHDVDLTGVVAFPSSEPVTVGKLVGHAGVGHDAVPDLRLRARGHRRPDLRRSATTRSTTSGTTSWRSSPAAGPGATRPTSTRSCSPAWRSRRPGCCSTSRTTTTAWCATTSACDCRIADAGGSHPHRSTSAASARSWPPASASTARPSTAWSRSTCPARLGGGPATSSSSSRTSRPAPRSRSRSRRSLEVTDDRCREVVNELLRTSDNGVLAAAVWERGGGLRIDRSPPSITRAGKTLSYERLVPGPRPTGDPEPVTHDRRAFLKLSATSFVVIGAGGLLTACGSDPKTGEHRTRGHQRQHRARRDDRRAHEAVGHDAVRGGLNFIADTAAEAGGFAEANGLDLDLQFAQSAPLALQQLAAGNIDVIRNAPLAVVKAVSQEGAPFVVIGMPNQEMLYDVVSTTEQPVDSLAELEGKTVGMATLGGNAEDTFNLLLKGAGLDPA